MRLKEKSEAGMQDKKTKILIIALVSIFAFFIVSIITLYITAGALFYKYALDATYAAESNTPKGMLDDMPTPNDKSEWFEEVEKTVSSIESNDGYVLKAYKIYAEEQTHNWIISIHGYRGRAFSMSDYAFHFHNAGYNVLLPDLEGHGMSEGKHVGMGYSDRLDILKWIDLIISEDSEASIALHGVSMGGATVMMTMGEDLPSNVKVAVEDCGYSDVYRQFRHVIKKVLKLPFSTFIIDSANTTAKLKLGYSLKDINLISQLQKSKTPTLFIHGSLDTFVPFSMLDEVYSANENIEKQKLVIEGAGHACSATKDPEKYYMTVLDFIGKYI